MKLVHCAGTGTDVGKTYVGAAVLAELRRRGLRVAARKPAQSYDADERGPRDADVLAAATGEHPDDVCPPARGYAVAMAPPMAADVLGRPPFTVADLLDDARPWPDGLDVGWVEGVGGPRSPIAHDGDGVDLVEALRPELVVLVADAGLGTINAVRLCVDALAGTGVDVLVALNRFDPDDDLHRRNHEWLCGHLDAAVAIGAAGVVEVLSTSPNVSYLR